MFRVYFAFYKHFRLSMSELVCQLAQRTVLLPLLLQSPSQLPFLSPVSFPFAQHYVHFPRKAAK